MKLTFLGTGTSQGVPVVACGCDVCKSDDIHDKRLRTSVLVETDNAVFTIDAGPDFRQQMLREKVKKLDAIFVTHGHKDHVGGMDDIRAFNFIQRKPMTVYADEIAANSIMKEFYYAFEDDKYPGVPNFDLKLINYEPIIFKGVKIIPVPMMHLHLPVTAFRIGDLTYITDANHIPEDSFKLIEGSEILIINALRKTKHISHFNLEEALEVIARVNPRKAYLTHISHLMGKHAEVSSELPANVEIAYDGLQIQFS
jgi:phosphoribosyl 1,2-cyclic phosphate phosphodiesterase